MTARVRQQAAESAAARLATGGKRRLCRGRRTLRESHLERFFFLQLGDVMPVLAEGRGEPLEEHPVQGGGHAVVGGRELHLQGG
eukprot:4288827-Pyramimonas_sp.AAC.1